MLATGSGAVHDWRMVDWKKEAEAAVGGKVDKKRLLEWARSAGVKKRSERKDEFGDCVKCGEQQCECWNEE